MSVPSQRLGTGVTELETGNEIKTTIHISKAVMSVNKVKGYREIPLSGIVSTYFQMVIAIPRVLGGEAISLLVLISINSNNTRVNTRLLRRYSPRND